MRLTTKIEGNLGQAMAIKVQIAELVALGARLVAGWRD
jgi:hypothetical protein